MILKFSFIDYRQIHDNELLFATTNNVVGRSGLVMGAGNAKAMKDCWPTIANEFAPLCQGDYGIAIIEKNNGFLGAFQTKRHWRSPSSYALVENSVSKLLDICDEFATIHLPYPGIGNGGLDKNKVLDIIHVLPDNVNVYLSNSKSN